MALQNHGPLSKAKGKIGAVVYQQYEGMQVAKEYQPVVKNPQTTNQINQRAKFKLASQIVGQFADVLNVRLAKYSPYTRIRRGAAIKNLTLVATLDGNSAGVLTADVQNAINTISMSDIEAPAITTSTPGQIGVTATDGDIVIVTTVGYASDGMFEKKTTERYTSDGTAKVFLNIGSGKSTIMCVALRANTEEGRAIISNILASDNDWTNVIVRSQTTGDLMVSDLQVVDIIAE